MLKITPFLIIIDRGGTFYVGCHSHYEGKALFHHMDASEPSQRD